MILFAQKNAIEINGIYSQVNVYTIETLGIHSMPTDLELVPL